MVRTSSSPTGQRLRACQRSPGPCRTHPPRSAARGDKSNDFSFASCYRGRREADKAGTSGMGGSMSWSGCILESRWRMKMKQPGGLASLVQPISSEG